jgi:5'(3')-deoxyribonucleotidase
LFNLGLSEGYKLQLERDKEILVLNITDIATGKRTEVRGKPGYETNGYDPTDKLHQLLDKVGRSASVSDMMNGDVVTINPKHPKGASAKTATDKAYHESLEEALGEISKNSEIYVDMDGVLADFFGEWSKSQGVDNWKDIKDPAKAIGDIKSIDDFWLNLPVLPKAKELLGLIKQVKGKYKICTSPLADDPRSDPHKREWVKKNLAFFPPEEVIVTHNKPQFAKQKDDTPNILIDDYGVNINAWEEAGGIGFKYKDYKFNRTAKAIKNKIEDPKSVNEALDNPYPFNLSGPTDSQGFVATAQTPNGVLRMDFETTDYDNFGIDFAVGKSMGKTEAGDEFRVFATVVAMMNKWISTVGIEHVESFDFGANKGEHASDGRAKLYTRFAKKLASQLGWKLEQSTTQDRSTAFFKLTNPKPVPREQEYWDALEENFADGKKKGKSRPGRVKKSGASCNGTVTQLRKRAKNASGEKAKMYHWCANMKGGKK